MFNLQAKLVELKLAELQQNGFRLVAVGYEADNEDRPVLFAYKDEPTKADLCDKTAIIPIAEAADILADVFDRLPSVITAYPRLLQAQ